MARGADCDKYFSESADAEITRRLCETAPCTRRLDAVSDGTALSRPLPAQCGQFLGRTFWRGRKLTLNLTKRRAHTPSIKTVVMDLLTEQARSACRDADRSTHPPH